MNVVVYSKDFKWAGGADFVYGLVLGLLHQKKQPVKIFILVDEEGVKNNAIVKAKLFLKLLPSRVKNLKRTIANFFKKFSTVQNSSTTNTVHASGYNYYQYIHELYKNEDVEFVYYNSTFKTSLNKALQKINATVLLPVLFPENILDCPTPKVGYIFDFVYKHFPYLYTTDFCLDMDINFAKTIKYSKAVIVNSKKTAADANTYFPYKQQAIVTMPFAPYANEQLYNQALQSKNILQQYNITTPFFMLCNQLWLHKDHETAIKALKIVLQKQNVQLICTGTLTDLSGTNNRYNELQTFVQNQNVQNNVAFLGHISREDQLALMLHCCAVIQPTKFEGGPGGGSVYMSTAYGVDSIVSNIEVNKEIENESLVNFFEVGNSQSLADEMLKIVGKKRNLLTANEVIEKNKIGLQKLGEAILLSIQKTIA